MIVWQHAPGEMGLERMIWRLLGPRLRGVPDSLDPLVELRAGMRRLAVRDSEQRLVAELEHLLAVHRP